MPKFYITTAIPYASKAPHIGNAYEAVLTDCIARYRRLRGDEVYFLTGTDEYGLKIEKQAAAEGVTPQELVDKISGKIRSVWDCMNVSYDDLIRTTQSRHGDRVKKIFEKLLKQGDIYKSSYEGWYCTPDESFFTDTQVTEKRVCPECGRPVERAGEEAYFFKLSNYQQRLMEHMEANPDFIKPESRKNEMINNFLKPGLQDLCVTRTSFKWGISVESDPLHVVYVWIDALCNYITALGYNPDGESEELFNKNWPADLHVVGKDVTRFHALYWPCILLALGLPLYKTLYSHGFLKMGSDKMSKSLGNAVYAEEMAEIYGTDAVRYYVLREMPFSGDGAITSEMFINRYNSDLANDLGNLLSRSTAMCEKYFGGSLPAEREFCEPDGQLKALAVETISQYNSFMEELNVSQALSVVMKFVSRANKYIDETMPWILAKSPEKAPRLAGVLSNLFEALRLSGTLLSPAMPAACDEIAGQLGLEAFSDFSFAPERACYSVKKGEALFARVQ